MEGINVDTTQGFRSAADALGSNADDTAKQYIQDATNDGSEFEGFSDDNDNYPVWARGHARHFELARRILDGPSQRKDDDKKCRFCSIKGLPCVWMKPYTRCAACTAKKQPSELCRGSSRKETAARASSKRKAVSRKRWGHDENVAPQVDQEGERNGHQEEQVWKGSLFDGHSTQSRSKQCDAVMLRSHSRRQDALNGEGNQTHGTYNLRPREGLKGRIRYEPVCGKRGGIRRSPKNPRKAPLKDLAPSKQAIIDNDSKLEHQEHLQLRHALESLANRVTDLEAKGTISNGTGYGSTPQSSNASELPTGHSKSTTKSVSAERAKHRAMTELAIQNEQLLEELERAHQEIERSRNIIAEFKRTSIEVERLKARHAENGHRSTTQQNEHDTDNKEHETLPVEPRTVASSSNLKGIGTLGSYAVPTRERNTRGNAVDDLAEDSDDSLIQRRSSSKTAVNGE